MPELCRFLGIIIKMYFNDIQHHNKPHFHVNYGSFNAVIGIDGELLSGSLPIKQLKIVEVWAMLHEDELYTAWNKAVKNENFGKISPLK